MLHTVKQPWSPGAKVLTYISLDCVSGRLLDKDHNMTLFLFCAGSVNRRKAAAAQRSPVQVIDHGSHISDHPSLQEKNLSTVFYIEDTASMLSAVIQLPCSED